MSHFTPRHHSSDPGRGPRNRWAMLAASAVVIGGSIFGTGGTALANTTPGSSANGEPPQFLPAPNATPYCDGAVYFSAIDEVQALYADNNADIEPLIDQNGDGNFTNDTGTQSVVEFTASAAGGSPSLTGTREAIGGTNGTPTPNVMATALDIGVVMNGGAQVGVTLSEPLFYTQWIFTDVDGASEGFTVTPSWAGTPGEIGIFGGHPDFSGSGTTTSVTFQQTGSDRAGGGEAISGRIQTDLLGPVTGLTMLKTGGTLSGAGFTVGGGCEALGVAKSASTPTWNAATEVYEVTYTIAVANNLPTTAELATLVSDAQNNGTNFDFVTNPPTGISISDVSLDDPLTLTGFSGATVTELTSTGTLTPNPDYNGTGDAELVDTGQTLAPGQTETFTLTVSYTPEPSTRCNGNTISNQATATGTAAGASVSDQSDSGSDPSPSATNGAGTNDDATQVAFPVAEACATGIDLAAPSGAITGANSAAYPVSGTCTQDGDLISVVVNSVDVTPSPAPTCSSGAFSFNVDASSVPDGTGVDIVATVTDDLGFTTSSSDTETVTVNAVAPTISQDAPGDVSDANQLAYPVSGTCSADGDDVTVTVDDGVNTPVTSTVTCAIGVYSTTLDVSGLADGSVGVSSSIDDGVNSPVVAGPVSVSKDTNGASVAQAAPGDVSSANRLAYPVSGTCTEDGDSVTVAVDDGVNAPVTDTVSCSGGAYSATLDVSGLNDGSVDVSSSISDGINSPVVDGPVSVSKDTNGVSVSQAAPGDVSSANRLAYPVSGTCSADGDDVTVTVDDGVNTPVTSTVTCASGAYSTMLDVSGLADGSVGVSSSIDDGVNSPVVDGPVSVSKDTNGASVAQAAPGDVSSANRLAYPVSGTCTENGDSVTVTVDDGVNTPVSDTVACSGGAYSTTLDVSGLNDGSVDVSSSIDDGVNPAATAGPTSVTKDSGLPTVSQAAPGSVTAANEGGYPVSGTCSADGDDVTVTVDDGVNTPVSDTVACSSGAYSTTLDVSGLNDGSVGVSSAISDRINSPVVDGPASVSKDTVDPTINQGAPGSVTAANQLAYPVSGTCSADGDDVTVTVDDGVNAPVTSTVNCASGAYSTMLDVSGLDDGSVGVSSSIDDGVNPPATAGPTSVTKDSGLPTVSQGSLAPISVLSAPAYPVTGTCSADGDAVTVTLTDGAMPTPNTATDTVICSGGAYSATVDASGLDEGPVDVSSTITDGINPPVTAGPVSVSKDAIAPALLLDAPDDITAANASSYPVSGDCSPNGDTVVVTATVADGAVPPNTVTSAPVTCTGGRFSIVIDATGLDEGPVTVSSTIDDGVNPPVSSFGITTEKDTVVSMITNNPPVDVTDANESAYPVSGTCSADGDEVTVTVDDGVNPTATATTTCSGGTYSATLDVSGLADGPVAVASTIDDGVNPPTPTTPAMAQKDTALPIATIDTPVQITESNLAAYPVTGTCSAGDEVVVEITGGATASATTMCTAEGTFATTLDLTDLEEGPLDITASVDDGVNTQATASGDIVRDLDPCVVAGEAICFTIEGRVFLDADREGDLDVPEVDISGVELELVDSNGDVVAMATTASPFRFENVAPGSYVVRIVESSLPAGVGLSFEVDGSLNGAVGATVVDADIIQRNFGYKTSQITGVVRDASGQPIANQPVTVTDAAGNTFSTVADENGVYVVTGTLDEPVVSGTATAAAQVAGRTVTSSATVTAGGDAVLSLAATTTPATSRQSTGSLPRTGSNGTGGIALSGTVSMLAGFVLLAGVRRRSDEEQETTRGA